MAHFKIEEEESLKVDIDGNPLELSAIIFKAMQLDKERDLFAILKFTISTFERKYGKSDEAMLRMAHRMLDNHRS